MKPILNTLARRLTKSIRSEIAKKRSKSLQEWVCKVMGQQVEMTKMIGVNSRKQFYRITNSDDGIIAVDMPVSKRNVRFLQLSNLLRGAGVRVPKVYAHQLNRYGSGFYIVEHLGDSNSYRNVLKVAPWRSYNLYREAWELIAKIQAVQLAGIRLPSNYDIQLEHRLRKLPKYYADWHRNRPLIGSERISYLNIISLFKKSYRSQTKVLIHSDYGVHNIFNTNYGPAVIDFAGLGIGPPTYDIATLVSTIFDDEMRLDYIKQHWEHSVKAGLSVNTDFSEHYRQLEWIIIQIMLAGLYRTTRRPGYQKKERKVNLYEKNICSIALCYKELLPLVKIIEKRAR